ncbi:MAG TPA: tetratricopeptide repeat protein [Pyrinomonadaceae bacterium]
MSALAATFVVALSLTVLAQNQGSVPPAQVAQIIETVRTSSDEKVFTSALALGVALLRESRFDEAAQLYDALAEKRPHDASVLYGAALSTFNVGRPAEAESLARRAVDAALALAKGANVKSVENERASDALVLLGVVLAVRNDDAGALKAIQQAVQLAPNNFDAQLALGRALFGMGDDAGATRAFRAAVALKPSDTQALFFLATTLEHNGDMDAALAAYRELVARQPRTAEGHLGLGVLLLKRSGAEADEGVRELERALEINPDLYEARVALGRVLITRGRANDAVEHLRRAAELAPGNPEPHYQLSLAYRRLGRKDEAEAESEIVKRIHESRRGQIQENAPTKP